MQSTRVVTQPTLSQVSVVKRSCFTSCRPAAVRIPRFTPVSQRSSRGALQIKAGLLDLFSPAKPSSSKNRAAEIVDDILELTKNSNAGLSLSKTTKREVAELVSELEQYCPRAPLKGNDVWGEWEAIYASEASSFGGPFLRGPVGQLVLPGQQLMQVLDKSGTVKNFASYKALGFLPGKQCQYGELEVLDGTTYQVSLYKPTGKFDSEGEPVVSGEAELFLQQQVVYVDDRIRVNRLISAQKADGEEKVFEEEVIGVFKRPGVEAEIEDDEEVVLEQPVPAGGTGLFGGLKLGGGASVGLATQAERAYYDKRGATPSAPTKPKAEGTARLPRGAKPAAKPAAKAADTSAQQAAEARRKAAEEAAALKAAINNQIKELREAARAASADVKAATTELKSAEKSAQPVIRSAQKVLGRISAIREEEEEAAGQLQQLREQEQETVVQLKDAAQELKEMEKAVGLKA